MLNSPSLNDIVHDRKRYFLFDSTTIDLDGPMRPRTVVYVARYDSKDPAKRCWSCNFLSMVPVVIAPAFNHIPRGVRLSRYRGYCCPYCGRVDFGQKLGTIAAWEIEDA